MFRLTHYLCVSMLASTGFLFTMCSWWWWSVFWDSRSSIPGRWTSTWNTQIQQQQGVAPPDGLRLSVLCWKLTFWESFGRMSQTLRDLWVGSRSVRSYQGSFSPWATWSSWVVQVPGRFQLSLSSHCRKVILVEVPLVFRQSYSLRRLRGTWTASSCQVMCDHVILEWTSCFLGPLKLEIISPGK